jgi:hypothetical protein
MCKGKEWLENAVRLVLARKELSNRSKSIVMQQERS